MLCVVSHKSQVFVTEIVNLSTVKKSTVVFAINQLFEHLEPNFEVQVQFYSITIEPWMIRHKRAQSSEQSALLCPALFGSTQAERKGQTKRFPDISTDGFQVVGVRDTKMSEVSVLQSAFCLVGSLTINLSNWTMARRTLLDYNISSNACEDMAIIDMVLSIQYGARYEEGVVSHPFVVHIDSRHVHVPVVDGKRLQFKLHMAKCILFLEDKWLIVNIKFFGFKKSLKFDLTNCINGGNCARRQTIAGMPDHVACLIFEDPFDEHKKKYHL